MFSIKRYTVYIALAAFFLLALNHFRHGLESTSGARYGASQSRPGGTPTDQPSLDSRKRFQWNQIPVRYPVSSLTALPTGEPLRLPRVQFDFPAEGAQHAATRKERQLMVKGTFERCWKAYRQHAWMRDELAPLSGGYKDGFGGWAASLVDNLDNLWLMGLKTEFEDAVAAAVEIDLGKVTIDQINVFETTIRHLGGFLSAYDLSGDRRLLDKAREFGEMLLVAFDTPNRMPIMRWLLHDAMKGERQVADLIVLVAEIGSLSMEFTRLSLITGDPRWYDAVERIVATFAKSQDQTHLPGMWPVHVNARHKDFTQGMMFTLSAMSDSVYEYFPKMHALLGGLVPIYQELYDKSMAAAIQHNLWRPMTPDNADILISGNVYVTRQSRAELDPQGQHLVCFAGGMFALGGKLFNQPRHVEIGRKLTDGCVWTYKALPLGIMPEIFNMVPCESRSSCQWDEERWKREVKKRMKEEKEDVDVLIERFRLPKGFTELTDPRYILRPEAIESVFILYRITGDPSLQEAAWEMFRAIVNATETPLANAALSDISLSREQLAAGNTGGTTQMDSMESFWMAETLKYFYLIFSEPDVIDLDKWVFNTEAHPFKRLLPST